MFTHQLPHESWKSFLDRLTRAQRGAHVVVELGGGGLQPRCYIQRQPLVGVAAREQDGERPQIEVIAGEENDLHTHAVRGPRRLLVTERDDGSPIMLQICGDDGSVTSLRFGSQDPEEEALPGAFLG